MPDNALFFEGSNPANPGTHVLIIGVSAYEHLLGGSQPRAEIASGMGQLDSPARSARVLAKWFLEEFHNTERPLQSLAMLLSEPEELAFENSRLNSPSKVPPKAIIEEVATAVDYWIERASQCEGNLTIFFFAGHGLTSNDPLLILSDFGRRISNRFDASINFNDFVGGMSTMAPSHQVFLIDACRGLEARREELSGLHKGRGLVSPTALATTGRSLARQSVHQATSDLSPAYGRPGGISLYTEALIQALRGGGAQANFAYKVGTGGLEVALAAYLERLSAQHGVEQVPERARSSVFAIHQPKEIRIPLYVQCVPDTAWAHLEQIEATCLKGLSARFEYDPQNPALEWGCVVPHMDHTLAAKFRQGAAFNDAIERVSIAPPETLHVLSLAGETG